LEPHLSVAGGALPKPESKEQNKREERFAMWTNGRIGRMVESEGVRKSKGDIEIGRLL
jgi:hypothetical protein